MRLWVDPPPGYNDLASDLALARQVEAAGMKIFLDIQWRSVRRDRPFVPLDRRRRDDLPLRGGGASAHGDVPAPRRLPYLAERRGQRVHRTSLVGRFLIRQLCGCPQPGTWYQRGLATGDRYIG